MILLIKLLDIIRILFSKHGGINYLLKKNSSIASFFILRFLKKRITKINTILDVGANIGQFAQASYIFYPEAKIHSFEPVPETFEKLKKNCFKISNIKIYNCALGNIEGKIEFFQNNHSHASSALEVSNFQKEALPKTKNYKKIQVTATKLDNVVFNNNLDSPILLKLDVQGFEKQVLQGAGSFLNKVDYLLLEMSFVPMYNNEPLFDEMHQYIKDKGFSLIGPVGFLPAINQQIMQMDMLYKRV